MATSSLGRLTLDLLVKLAGFEQGLDAAERKAKKSSENMKQAFSGFKEQIADALGGTQIGSVIDGFNSKIGTLKGGVLVAGAAIAGPVERSGARHVGQRCAIVTDLQRPAAGRGSGCAWRR